MSDETPDEFPVPAPIFLKTLVGTADEVWSHLLHLQHGVEKHTLTEWTHVLDALRAQGV